MKNTYQIVIIGLLSAIVFALQVALASLPNVELVTLLLLVYSLTLPLFSSILISIIFTTLEMLIWGFGDWVVGYFWIWPLWNIVAYFLKPIIKENLYYWAIISGLWGAIFGGLFAINHGIFYGFSYSLAYWLRGIPFDIIHAISNYVITLILFVPTLKVVKQLLKKYFVIKENF